MQEAANIFELPLHCFIGRHSRPLLFKLSHTVPSALRSRESWHHQEPKTPCQGWRAGGNTEMQPSERTQLSLLSAASGGRSEIHDYPEEAKNHRRVRNANGVLFCWVTQRATRCLEDTVAGAGRLFSVFLCQFLIHINSVMSQTSSRSHPGNSRGLGKPTCLISDIGYKAFQRMKMEIGEDWNMPTEAQGWRLCYPKTGT